MIHIAIHARADLGRDCLCARLSLRHDVHLAAVGDDLEHLGGRAAAVPVDAVLALPAGVGAGAGARGFPSPEPFRALWPSAAVLAASFHSAVDAGAEYPEGYAGRVDLTCPVDELVRQLRVAKSAGVRHVAAARTPKGPGGLTARETVVLTHLALGHSSRASAELLALSPRTIDGHRRRLSGKLGRASVAELTCYAIASGLIEAGSGLFPTDRSALAKFG